MTRAFVPLAVRRAVLARDGQCVLAKLVPDHVCRDFWGRIHAPDDLRKLSMEHVKEHSMMGKRAPSDERHLVAMCIRANVDVPSKSVRNVLRAYLASVAA